VLAASYGPAPAVGEGAQRGATVELMAALPADTDRERMHAALRPLGCRDIETRASVVDDKPALLLAAHAPAARVDEVARALWSLGARRVRTLPSAVRAPEVREVTVALGQGNKKVPVRVAIVTSEGELLWREPNREDVIAAARQLGVPPGAVRGEALLESESREEPDEQQ
jgi:uncharacterized protein (DUF111 family)